MLYPELVVPPVRALQGVTTVLASAAELEPHERGFGFLWCLFVCLPPKQASVHGNCLDTKALQTIDLVLVRLQAKTAAIFESGNIDGKKSL